MARKTVRYVVIDTDRYGRSVSLVYLGQTCVNAAMVHAGLAWALPANAPPEIRQLEQQARFGRKGLWAAADVMPPWEWRRQAKTGHNGQVPPEDRRRGLSTDFVNNALDKPACAGGGRE